MLETKISDINYLTQTLQEVSGELQGTINLELQRLKEEEQQLKNAIKLKTRRELMNSMERELAMDNINNNNDFYSKTFSNFSTRNNLYETTKSELSPKNLAESIKLTDDYLQKSHQVLQSLISDYATWSAPNNKQFSASNSASEFLRQSASNPIYKNNYLNYDKTNYIRPNVVNNRN